MESRRSIVELIISERFVGSNGCWLHQRGRLDLLVVQSTRDGFGLPRHIASGLPALIIVLGAILLEKIYGTQVKNKPDFRTR